VGKPRRFGFFRGCRRRRRSDAARHRVSAAVLSDVKIDVKVQTTNVLSAVVRLVQAMVSVGAANFHQPRADVGRPVAGRGCPQAVVGALAGLLSSAAVDVFASGPFLPAKDSEVVVRLRPAALTAAQRELRTLRSSLAAEPGDLPLAVEVARRLIARARAEADPRYLGQAEVALAPCWTNAAPPAQVLVLRATIRQSLHDFPAALADLDAALALDPRDVQAWLTKATVHTVRGEFDQARRAWVPLLRLTDPLTATTAAAAVASLTGEGARSLKLLGAALDRQAGAPIATRVWALTQLAETTARLGRTTDAERHFNAALALAPHDLYLLGAYADFLLDQRRPDEAATLVRDSSRIDGLLLRYAEAQQAGGHDVGPAVEELGLRFDNARARGDRVHLREEARFRLRLRHQPAAALELARANWLVQKEPADACLLLETARAAGDATVEGEVLAWAATNRLEDIHLQSRAVASRP
jgi:tetratricopeptide (TPR) repeat protein